MLELFRVEAENQTAILTSGLLELERGTAAPQQLEMLMRAAHSLKGAARIVNLQTAVRVAHAMEDCFVLAQQGKLELRQRETDLLFRGIDLLGQISKHTETEHCPLGSRSRGRAAPVLRHAGELHSGPRNAGARGWRSQPLLALPPATTGRRIRPSRQPGFRRPRKPIHRPIATRRHEDPERVVRLTAENLNRLLGLAGESLVESRWLRPFADSLQRLKRHQTELADKLDDLRDRLREEHLSEPAEYQFNELGRKAAECQQFLTDRMQELDMFDRRSAHLSQRMYLEVLRTRMRPFSDGVRRFPRMVRDLARALDKEVRLEIIGENTQVDRDILERLESPLAHLLRNAVDHGCETREQRLRAGKPPEGTIRVEARHSAGMLLVTVADDGAGVQLERVREAIVARRLTTPAAAANLTEPELLEFLFLPGFTLKEDVTEISGRGVGLDVVQNMVRSVRGNLRVSTQPGRGLRDSTAVAADALRAARLAGRGGRRTLRDSLHADHPRLEVAAREHRSPGRPPSFSVRRPAGRFAHGPPGLRLRRPATARRRSAGRRAGRPQRALRAGRGPLSGRTRAGGATARCPARQGPGHQRRRADGGRLPGPDRGCGRHASDPLRSWLPRAPSPRIQRSGLELTARKPKRILAVDDSLTVRELVRKILTGHGYLADVAVDGVEGWNAVRAGHYDLVITDVDMPRLDGIELATLIKKDPLFKSLPVMIVSYKDREEDRLRGLEAGADYYLTKGGFHDETLLQAVVDLIGEPEA